MLRPRIIPCLLIKNGGLVKTVNFRAPTYVGDPLNAVRIFNEKEVDELVIFDIDASVKGEPPNFKEISKFAKECRMPLCYGGGVKDVNDVLKLIDLGVEKVAISSAAVEDPALIKTVSNRVGSQSVAVVLDIKVKPGILKKKYQAFIHNSSKYINIDPIELALRMQESGAGEIIVNNISADGKMTGYDLDLAKEVLATLAVPVLFLGGAGSLEDIGNLFEECGIIGAGAGSLFVFKGKYRAVLINYPSYEKKSQICDRSDKKEYF